MTHRPKHDHDDHWHGILIEFVDGPDGPVDPAMVLEVHGLTADSAISALLMAAEIVASEVPEMERRASWRKN